MDILYLISGAGFIALVIVFYFLLYKNLVRAIHATNWPEQKKKKISTGFILTIVTWCILIAGISLSGFSSNFDRFPLNMGPWVMLPLLVSLPLLFTKTTKDIVEQLSLKALTQLQVFRVFVEILLWLLFIQNLLPIQMTFEGMNWDILTGITALLAARFFLNSKRGMITWNILGLVLLLNIVVISILSFPSPWRVFHNEPANRIIAYFPFIYLPTLLVPLAYGLHFLSLRKLVMKP